jgi:hypothetical protein
MECPEGVDEKYSDLTKERPLGECVLTSKMETFKFQDMAATAMVNIRKTTARPCGRDGAAATPASMKGRDSPVL